MRKLFARKFATTLSVVGLTALSLLPLAKPAEAGYANPLGSPCLVPNTPICYVWGEPVPWSERYNAENYCKKRYDSSALWGRKPPTFYPWCLIKQPSKQWN
jgi:hypothetical protein